MKNLHLLPFTICALAYGCGFPAQASDPLVPRGQCILYSDKNFQGLSMDISSNAPDASSFYDLVSYTPISNMSLDKNVSSIACAKTCSIVAYDQLTKNGTGRTFTGVVIDLGKEWNDRIRSVEVSCSKQETEAAAVEKFDYSCMPKVSVTVAYDRDGVHAFLTGLTDQEIELETGSTKNTFESLEEDASVTLIRKGELISITRKAPKSSRKVLRCKQTKKY